MKRSNTVKRPYKVRRNAALTLLLFITFAVQPALAERAVVVPEETMVYAELPREVTSKRTETNAGDVVQARVYRDVLVDGEVVIEEGSELLLRVNRAKKAKMLGRKGRLELEAISVGAVDGTEIPLTGIYSQTGKGRKVLTGTLAVVVAWPFVFLKGKNAMVNEGTVFEAYTVENSEVEPWPSETSP